LSVVPGISHDLTTVWTVHDPDPAVICEMSVTYERHDGSRLTLPCLNVFRLRDGRIADYRIYMDINPVFAPKERDRDRAELLDPRAGAIRRRRPPRTPRRRARVRLDQLLAHRVARLVHHGRRARRAHRS